MKSGKAVLFVILLLFTAGISHAAQKVAPDEATRHLTDRVAPNYPQMAHVANIQGSVVLQIDISETGAVTQVIVVSGHPLLISAAIDAVKTWRYKPFLVDDKAVAVQTIVTVPFFLDSVRIKKEIDASDRYFTCLDLCRKQMDDHQLELAEETCKRAVTLSSELDPGRTMERSDAYQLAGEALFGQSEFAEALEDYQQELRLRKDWGNDSAGLADAQHDVANGLWRTGRTQEARQFFEKAESVYRRAIKNTRSAVMQERYGVQLKRSLLDHAAMLRQTGETSRAELLEKEAAALTVGAKVGHQ